MVDGTEVTFESFLMNRESYISIRDFAVALNGSSKQFAVGYDAQKKAVTLTVGRAYTLVGTELEAEKERRRRFAEGEKLQAETGVTADLNTPLFAYDTANAVNSTSKVYLNGREIRAKGNNIEGNYYLKAKDLAQLLDVGYAVDSATGAVAFQTNSDFQA